MTDTMTKGEREELLKLVRARERALKTMAQQRTLELIADFEAQIAAEYQFDDDKVWAEATAAAEKEVERAQEIIAARCEELGIPKQFAPGLGLSWRHTGHYGNAVKERRDKLRRVAVSKAEALEAKAISQIAMSSVEAQTKIATSGLTSDAARVFVDTLPQLETLMPALSYEALAGKSKPPLIERLITPPAVQKAAEQAANVTALQVKKIGKK